MMKMLRPSLEKLVLVGLAALLLSAAGVTAAPKEMSLRVTSPQAESQWTVGTNNTVKWSFRGELGSTVSLSLQRVGWVNARMNLAEVAPIGQNRAGSFKWFVPAELPPGGNYTLTVIAENGIGDSSGEFSLVAGKTPLITLKNVVLPEPLGPMIAAIFPASRDKSISLTAIKPPKVFFSFSVRSSNARPPYRRNTVSAPSIPWGRTRIIRIRTKPNNTSQGSNGNPIMSVSIRKTSGKIVNKKAPKKQP